jgi:hypothetical protein
MRRFSFYITVALLTFGIGSFIAFQFFWHTEKQPAVQSIEEFKPEISIPTRIHLPQIRDVVLNEIDECEEYSDEVIYQPIIKKWLRGETLKNVPYCSKNGKEAKGFNGLNVTPSLVDLNKDGKSELVLESGCSPTGNCNMEIFERTEKGNREIFSAVHGVQVFGLNKSSNKGYYDIWARMHGSWNSGDMIVYRFNGKNYKPLKCFEYLYEEDEDKNGETKAKDKPTLTPIKCSRLF